MKQFLRLLLPLLAIGLGVFSCIFEEDDHEDCTCALYFASVSFHVFDAGYKPATNFVLTITNERTDEKYNVTQPAHDDGLYHALNDSFTRRIEANGDPILVHGEDGARLFDARFVIATDDCRCHVHKVSGPDTVVVQG